MRRSPQRSLSLTHTSNPDFDPWKDKTMFFLEYSPLNGLITALATDKAGVETVHWSDVAFAMWEAVTSFSGLDIKKLRYIAQSSINHVVTLSIIQHLVEGQPKQVKVLEPNMEGFFAILGTPNGVGSVNLLMEHKRQLGTKTIAQAVVFGKTPSEWHVMGPDVVFVLRDRPVPKMGRAGNINTTSLDGLTDFCRSLNGSSSEALSDI
ncbi:MAG: hypothetical protein Q9181_002802 [Wetmoreana brouardii]